MSGHAARTAGFAAVAIVLGLAVLEGISALTLRTLEGDALPVAERRHTRFDPELGWVNVPGARVENLYGPGRTLTINAQGFRGPRDTPAAAPEGKIRVLCGGDSFTLGWGVDDADTWPAALERLAPELEAVNLGQGGYGVDQIYLWARRDGPALEHRLHVVAVISEDFVRMRSDSFRGYAKPTLRLEGDVPVASGVPLSPPSGESWLERRATMRLLRRVLGREASGDAEPVMPLSAAAALGVRALEVLAEDDASRGARFLAVWLPTLPEYAPGAGDPLRGTVVRNLRAAGVEVLDLVETFRRLPPREADSLFLTDDEVTLPFHGRHYSARGNEWVARQLIPHLLAQAAAVPLPAPAPPAADSAPAEGETP